MGIFPSLRYSAPPLAIHVIILFTRITTLINKCCGHEDC
jgi:hypothetical protein